VGTFAVLAFKIAFLVLLWLFIAAVALAIRGDLATRSVLPAGQPTAKTPAAPPGRGRAKRRPTPAGVLAIDSGKLAGQRLQLVEAVRIGRSADCELNLDDEYVTSKHPHASLTRQSDGSWLLTDLGSTNGTYVNGQRLTGPKVVTPEDTIQIGRTQMRLEQ